MIAVANPVWETAWRVPVAPPDGAAGFDPAPVMLDRVDDGGGSALNTACALACAGRRVLAVGRVGDDEAGRAAIEALERRGIDARIEVAPGRATKRNHLYVGAAPVTVAFRAVIPPLCAPAWEEGPAGLLDSRILLLDRLAAAAPGWLRSRAAAGRPGYVNAFNRNRPAFRGPAAERYRAALPFLDYIQVAEGIAPAAEGIARIAGEDAARAAAEGAEGTAPARAAGEASAPEPAGPAVRGTIHSPPDAPPLSGPELDSIAAAGVSILVRTRGARGAIVHSPPRVIEVPALPAEVIDPTGAGDAFAAGFLDGLIEGADLVRCAERAVDWGARACRHLGARGWLDREPPERH